METVDIREFEQEFVIHFGTQRQTINAYTLASTLVSLADAVKEANIIINPGYEIEVLVDVIGPGSFRARIKAIYRGLQNLFSGSDLKAIVLGVVASYVYQITLAPDIKIQINVGEKQVVIEQGNHKVIIPREVHDAVKQVEKSEKFKNSLGQMFDAVERDKEISSIGIARTMSDEKPPIEIPRDRFALISRRVEPEEGVREVEEVTEVQISRAILDRSKRRWEFVWRGIKIPAPVSDDKFYDDFFAHRITIAPGDQMSVRLRIYQRKNDDTGIFINERYEIIEVLKHIRRVSQIEADLKNETQ